MVLEQLSVINFRNLTEASLSFSPKINCFVGHNGAGKSNVLDAVYFLSFCHSAHTPQDQLVMKPKTIRWTARQMHPPWRQLRSKDRQTMIGSGWW